MRLSLLPVFAASLYLASLLTRVASINDDKEFKRKNDEDSRMDGAIRHPKNLNKVDVDNNDNEGDDAVFEELWKQSLPKIVDKLKKANDPKDGEELLKLNAPENEESNEDDAVFEEEWRKNLPKKAEKLKKANVRENGLKFDAPENGDDLWKLNAPENDEDLWKVLAPENGDDLWKLNAPEGDDLWTLNAPYEEDYRLDDDATNATHHEDCIAAWTKLSQNSGEDGCVDKKIIRKFARNCRIPELRQQMVDLKSKCGKDKRKQFMAIRTDVESSTTRDSRPANETAKSRSKRMVLSSERSIWPGGKVPVWDATSQGNIRAMKVFERFTCIRFYPWEKNGDKTTNDDLGLDHQSYLKFIYDGGCWARQGNQRDPNGQDISCCGGITCVHEIGHALGAYHEHQNPLGKGIIRLNPENAEASKVSNFQETINPDTYSAGFDIQSIMAYGKTTFSNGNGEVISYEFSDIGGGSDWYYLLMEISESHHCGELYCSDFTMECVNDGYLTLVDDVCGCMCPPGLDPATGCSTVLKDDAEVKWPAGQYALPMTSEGCPHDDFSTGSIVETGAAAATCVNTNKRGCKFWFQQYGCDDNPGFMHPKCPVTCNVCHTRGNHKSDNYHLAGTTDATQVEHSVCAKESTDNDDAKIVWPAGQYCIYKMGGSCPDGFDSGSATFTDTGSNSQSGSLPDGEFTATSTKFEFCCTKYGFQSDELVLPRTKPFALLKSSDETTCHNVKGMHVYEGYTAVKNSDGAPTLVGATPVRPLSSTYNTYQIPYCYYTPTEKETCGGVIELTDANPTATLSGSAGPEFMCNWLVKGPEASRILLNFDGFNIASVNDKCVDDVTLRYNRLGQAGRSYCGDRLNKPISTVNNTLTVTYETHATGESDFSASVSLISQENLCYSVADRGHTYAGKVDRTRGLKTCIPWVQAAHCPHNPFKDGDMLDGLTDNYCRNPDTVDGLRPWCYTQAEGCQRDYCDVCLFEKLYDIESHDNCVQMAQNGACENDPNVQEKCAGTCSSSMPAYPEPTLAKDVTCPAPSELPDGDIVGATKSSYSVGDVVTYTCKDTSTPSAKERKCLSTGEWSSLNFVCTECELGWVHRNGNCYKLFKDYLNKPDAASACEDLGAALVMAKTADEMDFLKSIMEFWYGTWLDATDAEVEDEWKWGDGTAMDWTRWMSGQPENFGNEDCVWMTRQGTMEDRWCTRDTFTYVCMKTENAVTSCGDVTDDCANFYANDPTACTSQKDFMQRNCKTTCGLCGPN